MEQIVPDERVLSMNLYKSLTYRNDLDSAIDVNRNVLQEMEGKRIFITGASGLIGSGIVDLLLRYNECFHADIHIYAAAHDKEHTRKRFDYDNYFQMIDFIPYCCGMENEFDFQADYVIHGAGNAYPRIIQEHPSENVLYAVTSTYELLEYMQKSQAQNMIFISSSEIYGNRETAETYREDSYGSVDILNRRSSYAIGKQAAEALCAGYWHEKNTPVCIVRPGHIYGPTASINDNRVSSMFAYDAAAGKDLVLKSDGSQLRSYCYVLDCAAAILTVLMRGSGGEAYNISTPDSVITIRQIAELYAQAGSVNVKFDIPDKAEKAAFNPMSHSCLNSDKLYAMGWKAVFGSSVGVSHTVQIMREAMG